ncbi:MAG: HNH endonuclease, partial [Bacteroidales bacterium]|nr:HNH endonuclease [Bacteroidales bacterium]
MKIELHKITVRELTAGYEDNAENGVKAFGGNLDVRPPYQREFVYKENQRNAVIDTLTNGFPLNVMYWACREVSADEPSAP